MLVISTKNMRKLYLDAEIAPVEDKLLLLTFDYDFLAYREYDCGNLRFIQGPL